jgi:cell division protein FtsI (penicillin-binding protein 3)
MAGKTGTAAVKLFKDGGSGRVLCLSLLLVIFQLILQEYSCIVVVHKPSTVNNNYYGADVARFFKELLKKFTDIP